MLQSKNLIFILFLFIFSCDHKIKTHISQYEIQNKSEEEIKFYIEKQNEKELKNNLIVFIQGSGRNSIKNRFGMGSYFFNLNYDALYIEKYAIDNEQLFNETNNLERRIKDIVFVLEYVIEKIYNDKLQDILIISDSEGGVIAPEISLKVKQIKKIIVLGAGGYTQEEEFRILLEKQIKSKKKSFFDKSGIKNIQDLTNKIEEIKKENSSTKFWLGQTYTYWNSSLFYNPEPFIIQLQIPVLYIIGEDDKNVPVESVVYLKDKLADKKKFKFKIVKGLDHQFRNKFRVVKIEDILKKIIYPWIKNENVQYD